MFFTQSPASERSGAGGAKAHVRQDRGRDGRPHGNTGGAVRRRLHLGISDHAPAPATQRSRLPVFVANGDRDPMILPHYSYLLAGLIPQAQIKIYPTRRTGFSSSTTPSSRPTWKRFSSR